MLCFLITFTALFLLSFLEETRKTSAKEPLKINPLIISYFTVLKVSKLCNLHQKNFFSLNHQRENFLKLFLNQLETTEVIKVTKLSLEM